MGSMSPGGAPVLPSAADSLVAIAKAYTDGQIEARTDSSFPVYVYGNSYAVLTAGYFTSGRHYSQLAQTVIGAGAVTSYAVGGRRIIDVVSTMLTGLSWYGTNGVIAGGVWTSTTARPGLIIIDALGNDTAHYPSMVANPVVPAKITGVNFINSQKTAWRAALALASSESRVESAAATYGGAWSGDTAFTGMSGGSYRYSTTNGATATFSVTAPKRGPLAGKAYLHTVNFDPASGSTNAAFSITVDGGTPTAVTPATWEQYVGHAAVNIAFGPAAYEINVPADGAAHSVVVTHTGTNGQTLAVDVVTVPSDTPNPIAIMSHGLPPVPGVLTSTDCNNWANNTPAMETAVRSAVAEFGNAFWVPTTMTTNGLYSGDGLHPNDRGMSQRANDLVQALRINAFARLRNRSLQLQADATFSIV